MAATTPALLPALPLVEYQVAFPWKESSIDYPVEGLPGKATN